MKVLIVDDSIVFRSGIKQALEAEADIEVVGTAGNGKVALELMEKTKPDIITLDMEMPVMDGMTTLTEIRKVNRHVHVIVLSAFTRKGAEITVKALASGANDFITKELSSTEGADPVQNLRSILVPRIRQFKPSLVTDAGKASNDENKLGVSPFIANLAPELILIGSSTGGPNALRTVFSEIGSAYVPILIAQHMPALFTAQLAKMLDGVSEYKVKEAVNGEKIEKRTCYIAPGDFHMKVIRTGEDYRLTLNQEERVNFVRPAADLLFESVANSVKGPVLTFVLTGMGEDGARGVKLLKDKKWGVVIQSKNSSTVWGMPGAIFRDQNQDGIEDPKAIGHLITEKNKWLGLRKGA